ncbi:Phenylalanyl-tRNA synthetase beta chain [Emticicia oligotrophica DSM 17448]|uniref:Phenylalanine--tRNA ligase beta subunit n=1 Tax=Emticicia oligotrophica (strain DSM 17448 / CIP 109782 / MTCC 6937 / GPTSA100-15) TaxID=929562 RepID=A0ABN4ABS7_EMTOG|nr:phenylalanine--tRNA ligase subunit beta [Emticicia oligotrophica]AFK01614.1 Phenylalanyl-tRNA synthetase beta chain [Emticicia oligotrophica DSM 17448]
MKISYNWLKGLIDIQESAEEIGKLLTSTGLEVEGIEEIESIKGGLKGFVVGEVLTCEPFMVKDKQLSLTTVGIGAETPSTIVCGASNVRAGQKVIVATLGTTIYFADGKSFVIEKRKVYGHPSEGMICAEDELGIGNSHEGIMVLDTNLPNGTPAIEYFKSVGKSFESDYQIEIGLTPNRADAASHLGVARDLRAVLGREIKMPSVENFNPVSQTTDFEISIENNEACPRFCGLEIRGVKVQESPSWLKNALLAIGLNPINNIVDITNYICHTLGQPMHAFDADEVKGHKIVVRVPEKGTKFTTLDGVERTLSGNDLMVCNAEEPMAIAGVFGGQKSGIKNETQNVFLEVAYFNPVWVRRTATFHGLKTDASFRYERGTDPNMPPYAIRLAAVLIQEVAGGEILSGMQDVYPNPIGNFEFTVKHKNINRLIGKNLDDRLIRKILNSLDIEVVSDNGNEMQVSVPPYRVDVTREADVIEEILRIYGFDNIELSENLQTDFLSAFAEKDADKLQFRLIDLLAANGFNEIQTLSITRPSYNEALTAIAKGDEVKLLNPLSEELSVLRQSLLLTGMESVAYNINRRQKDLKLFEFGRSYFKKEDKYKENKHLGIWMTGNRQNESWTSPNTPLTFHDLALVVQKVLKAMKVTKFDTQEADSAVFQYGLTYLVNKKPIVSLGLVKPQLAKLADVKQAVFYADFDWEYLLKQYSGKVAFVEIPKFPEVRRDLSLVIDAEVKFEQVIAIANKTEKALLQSVNVFDVYAGEKLGEGKKSYSVSFTLIDKEKTLTDEVIDKTMQRLITAYEKELGAVIRK